MLSLSPVAYSAPAWTSFFSAQVSASAALAGLLFVAVSINLSRVVQYPHLTARVAKALVMLVAVLLESTLCLIPGQSSRTLGIELLVLGVLICSGVSRLHVSTRRGNAYMSTAQVIMQSLILAGASLPTIVCGVSLLRSRGGGLYWLLGTVVFTVLGALIDAWVLLIEIQR